MVTKTRAQDEDPKGKGVDTVEMEPPWLARFQEEFDRKLSRFQEAYDQRFLRIQEANDQRFSRLEAMAADLLCRSRKGKKENPEDQISNDEELTEIEAETKSSGIEDRAVENEANTKMISAKVKEESIPQSKVSIPQSNSEILKSIEPGKVDLGLEKLEHVMMNEVDGDIERGQEAMSNTKICSAHQLFDQMPGRSSRANRVWKPGGLWYVRDHSGGSILMITQQFHGLRLQRIIYMDMKFQEVIVDDVLSVMVCLCVPNKKFEAELEIYDCETKKHMLLLMKLADRVWECGELLATHVYCKWLVNIYDWCIVSQLWLDHRNKTCYAPIEDLFKETDAYFLRQEDFEQLLKTTLIIPQVMRDKKIRLSKRWWFKYRFDEEDQGSLQSRAGQRRNHGLFIRSHSKQKQRKCPKSWMFKFKTGSKLAGTSHLKRHKESGLCTHIRGVRKKSKLIMLSLCPSFLCQDC